MKKLSRSDRAILFGIITCILFAGILLWLENSRAGQRLEVNKLQSSIDKLAAEFHSTETVPAEKKCGLLLYEFSNGVNTRWNNNFVLPDEKIISDEKPDGFSKLDNGWYLWLKKGNRGKSIIGLVPVYNEFGLTNPYIRNGFPLTANYSGYFSVGDSAKDSSDFLMAPSGAKLFIKNINNGRWRSTSVVIFLLLSAFTLLLYFNFRIFSKTINNKTSSYNSAAVFLAGNVLLLLLCFTPLINRLAPSSGGQAHYTVIALMAATVLIVTVLGLNKLKDVIRRRIEGIRINDYAVVVFSAFIVVFITAFAGNVLVNVIKSSASFNVVDFFSLDRYSITGLLAAFATAAAYFFVLRFIILVSKNIYKKNFYLFLACIAVFFMVYLTVGRRENIGFNLGLAAWTVLFVFLLLDEQIPNLLTPVISSTFIFWTIFFSISLTLAVLWANAEKDIENRKSYFSLLEEKYYSDEARSVAAFMQAANPWFLSKHTEKFSDALAMTRMVDSITSTLLSVGIKNFDIRCFAFDSAGNTLSSRSGLSRSELENYLNHSLKTQYPAVLQFSLSDMRTGYVAYSKVPVNDTYFEVYFTATPKNSVSGGAVTNVFSKGVRLGSIAGNSLSAAIYDKGRLKVYENDYPFHASLPELFFAGRQYLLVNNGDYSELWYNAGDGKYMVVARKNTTFLQSVTLFSYIFSAALLLLICYSLLRFIIINGGKFNWREFISTLSIRAQVQGTIVTFLLLAFVIIGVTTVFIFINRFEENNRKALSSGIRGVQQALQEEVGFNAAKSSVAEQQLIINRLARAYDIDINIYDTSGNLQSSSIPVMQEAGFISGKIDPLAYEHLHRKKEIQYTHKESVGSLNYLSSYLPLRSAAGTVSGYINTPYFAGDTRLKQEISTFLVTLINLNAFIFLIAGLFAFSITNRITRSLAFIAEKMQHLSVSRKNEKIHWQRKDEIGTLVQQYNSMIDQLEQSALSLARSEREGAWSQMARQVAHEIKNPLTPMKLSMQFLQNALKSNDPKVHEMAGRMFEMMIRQVDNLSAIAGQFSQFASVDASEQATVDIIPVLQDLRDLYQQNTSGEIIWRLPDKPAYVSGNIVNINRLFTNLLLNALQAAAPERPLVIHFSATKKEGIVKVKIADNGTGIPEEIKKDIFKPNFTTKNSGSGLGLAMCKRIVEKMNGDIIFSSSANGTEFIVSFPLL